MQRVLVLKVAGRVDGVWLDAADVVRLHGVQLRHELAQLLLELASHAVELERLEALAGLGVNGCRAGRGGEGRGGQRRRDLASTSG